MTKLEFRKIIISGSRREPAFLKKSRVAVPFMALCFALFTGCSTLQLPAGLQPFTDAQVEAAEPAEPGEPAGEYKILLKPRHGTGSKATLKITENVLVQQVLESSRATKKFRAMEITIFRRVKGSPVPLKLMPKYDSQSNSVPPGQNYAVQAGDQILIEEKSNSSLGKTLGRLTGI